MGSSVSIYFLCVLSSLVFFSPSVIATSTEAGKNLQEKLFFEQLTAEEIAWINQGHSLSYTYDPDWPPFEWKSELGQHTGIIADLLALLKERTNLKFEPIETNTWSESVDFVRRGKAQMFSAITLTEERKTYLAFTSKNLYTYPAVLITHFEDNTVYLDIKKDATDKTIAIVKDSGLGKYVQDTHPELKYIYVTSTKSGFDAVLEGKADLFAINTITAKYFIEKYFQQDIKIATKLDYSYQLKIAIRKGTPRVLTSIFDKALNSITSSEKEVIFQKWTSIEKPKTTDWYLIAEISATFLLIILFLLWHNFQLKKAVRLKTRELRNLVNIDPLTGAYNRRKLEKDFAREIKRAKRHHHRLAMVYIDLNNFKAVNDQHGHRFGDSVLKLVSAKVMGSLREEERLYRLGGDEFCILIPEVSDDQELIAAKNRFRSFLLNIQTADGHSIDMSYSAGISLYPESGNTLDALMATADMDMYQQKKAFKC